MSACASIRALGIAGFWRSSNKFSAGVAKLVDALDLGSSAARRESSSLSFRTIYNSVAITRSYNSVGAARFVGAALVAIKAS